MDVLVAMQVFRRVVEAQSFTRAARSLRLSNAAVSKHVGALEERLNAKLIQRTTRRMSLTTAGAAYYERCARILDDLEETEQALSGAAAKPHGLLRVNAPMSFSLLHLSPLVPELLERWPALELDMSFTDQFVDVVEEGVDVVIRIASTLPDSATLVVQRLAGARQVLVASPSYLQKHGEPKTLADIAKHACIVYSLSRSPGAWDFKQGGAPARVPVNARLRFNNSLAVRDAALAGLGLAVLPSFYVDAELRKRRLRALLCDAELAPLHIYAAYQRPKQLSAKVRVFAEFLRERFGQAPWSAREP
jgi:DNA-binding transcriptional LysR family regulator